MLPEDDPGRLADHFADARTELPAHLDWEALGPGIIAAEKPRSRRRWAWWLGGAAGAGLLMMAVWWVVPTPGEVPAPTPTVQLPGGRANSHATTNPVSPTGRADQSPLPPSPSPSRSASAPTHSGGTNGTAAQPNPPATDIQPNTANTTTTNSRATRPNPDGANSQTTFPRFSTTPSRVISPASLPNSDAPGRTQSPSSTPQEQIASPGARATSNHSSGPGSDPGSPTVDDRIAPSPVSTAAVDRRLVSVTPLPPLFPTTVADDRSLPGEPTAGSTSFRPTSRWRYDALLGSTYAFGNATGVTSLPGPAARLALRRRLGDRPLYLAATLTYNRVDRRSEVRSNRPARLFRPGTPDTLFRNLLTGDERLVTTDSIAGRIDRHRWQHLLESWVGMDLQLFRSFGGARLRGEVGIGPGLQYRLQRSGALLTEGGGDDPVVGPDLRLRVVTSLGLRYALTSRTDLLLRLDGRWSLAGERGPVGALGLGWSQRLR